MKELYKLIATLDESEIARGSEEELLKIYSAFAKYGLRSDKFAIIPASLTYSEYLEIQNQVFDRFEALGRKYSAGND